MSYPPNDKSVPSFEQRPDPYSEPEDRAGRGVQVQFEGDKPFLVYILMGISILVFLSQEASNLLLGFDIPAALGLKSNQAILHGELWRLFTPMFLHASILHIAFNMYALNILGPQLERYYGRWRFLTLYLLSGFAGNVVSFLFVDADSLGASTAIFGLIGAQGVFLYQNQRVFGPVARRALVNVVTLAGINLLIGLSPGIDNWGHMGGLVAGTLFAWFAGPLIQVTGVYPALHLVDARQSGDVLRAGLVLGFLFALLASAPFILSSL